MRLARSTFIALAILAALATPAPGKNAKAQKQSEETAAPNCHAYQLAPDGNWVALPCEEEGAPKSTHHRAAPKSDNDEAR
jgi:hypothetical protein